MVKADRNKTVDQLLADAKAHLQKSSWLLLKSGQFTPDDVVYHHIMIAVSSILAKQGMRAGQLEIDWWYEENADQSS